MDGVVAVPARVRSGMRWMVSLLFDCMVTAFEASVGRFGGIMGTIFMWVGCVLVSGLFAMLSIAVRARGKASTV